MTLAKIDPRRSITVAEAEAHADNIVNEYSGWAKVLIRVVEEKKLYAVIKDKKYLEFEAWQLIGTFDHARADTDDVAPIERGGEIIGYICHAKVIKDGVRIGGATQMCGLDAYPCQGKEGSAKDNAAISTAQTWAASKAFRMLYSAVAILGGFGGATAEEMRHGEQGPDKTQHWCEAHQTNWFKRGKMRNFAHPIGDTKDWCNEPALIPRANASDTPDHVCPLPGCNNAKLVQSRRTGVWGHILEDGTPCLGETPTTEPDGSEADTPLGNLQRELFEAGMEWSVFEANVLHMTWPEWVKLGGTIETARKHWANWANLAEQEA